MKAAVEICAEGVEAAFAASDGEADRVELCENLAVGGVTPSAGMISETYLGLDIPVHVLIRPRAGDFVYRPVEIEVMKHDIWFAREFGVAGVVLGLLTADGRVALGKAGRLIEAARPMSVTFHKAFDATRDPFEALDDLIGLGVDRVLTSGQAPTAMAGLDMIAELTRRAAGRIAIMAGGSITLDQIRPIVEAGVKEIHLGSAACRDGKTDRALVRRIVELASMAEIFHITTMAEWERARAEGVYRADSLATEGFIHASTAGQVAGSANRFFSEREGLVVLRIDLDRVRSPIEWAASPHSDEPFPHVHGPLDVDAVIGVEPLERDGSGSFAWPSEA